MKKLVKIALASILSTSAVYAQSNNLEIIFPEDTYLYTQNNTKAEAINTVKSSISNDALRIIFPEDSNLYTENKSNTKVINSVKSSISNSSLKVIFPKDTYLYLN